MRKYFTCLLVVVATLCSTVSYAQITIDPEMTIGCIKRMNAVNNGPSPVFEWQSADNLDYYRNLEIPYARTHDSTLSGDYSSNVVDISCIFPDFSKDVEDPSSYDFYYTDKMMLTLRQVGTRPFFRLGESIENCEDKKYNIFPPSDFKKWARICEHIVRHYNYGWANGYELGIEYWEIWNEPDNDEFRKLEKSCTWGGTEEQFCELYATVACHLKTCFPEIKVGGPATTRCNDWIRRFMSYMASHKVPIDFFSWHLYDTHPEGIAELARKARRIADEAGYTKAESILDEWNYIKGWSDDYVYSMQVIHSIKGAAFTTAVMSACQYEPVDMLMYYDAQYGTPFNGLFDFYTGKPISGYYALYSWAKLAKYGTQVYVSEDIPDIYAVAARKADGSIAILVTRYNEKNMTSDKTVTIDVKGRQPVNVIGHLTDSCHLYTEYPLNVVDNKITVKLEPESFILIEL